jgi:hypothetical protein
VLDGARPHGTPLVTFKGMNAEAVCEVNAFLNTFKDTSADFTGFRIWKH